MEKYVIVREDVYGHIVLDVMASIEAMTLVQVLGGESGLFQLSEDWYRDGRGNDIWVFPLGEGSVTIDEEVFSFDRLVSIRGSHINTNGEETCSLVWTETPEFLPPLDDGSGETSTGFIVSLDTWADLLDILEKGGKMEISSEKEMRKLFCLI